MPALTRSELEETLGLAKDFVILPSNRHLVRQWAFSIGKSALEVNALMAHDLANLYHQYGPGANPLPGDDPTLTDNERFLKILEVVSKYQGFPPENLIKEYARHESELVHLALMNGDDFMMRVKNAVASIVPRQLEIIRPDAPVVTLNGPLHYRTELVIHTASLGHNIMMVGPAGCGKTTIGEHTARALGLNFYITSTINDTSELTGFIDGYGKYHTTPFRQAFQNGGVWIADEIDAWDAAALLAANSALANGFASFPDVDGPVYRNPNFRMIATANTFGYGADRVYIGRNELDAASLDRFALITVDYDMNLEQMFAGNNDRWLHQVWRIRKAVNDKKIRHVVSSRAIMYGATAIASGMDWKDVEELYLYKGMSKTDRDKIS